MAGPTYTYTPDVPQGPTGMNVTQPIILENFQAINELIQVDHVGFNVPNDFGKHNKLSLQFQTDAPTAISNSISMFCQETPSGPNDAEIFIQYPSGATTTAAVQISNPAAPSTGPGTSGTGYTTFDSSLGFIYGQTSMSNAQLFNTPSGVPSHTAAIPTSYGFLSPAYPAGNTYIGAFYYLVPNGNNTNQYYAVSATGTAMQLTNYFIVIGV